MEKSCNMKNWPKVMEFCDQSWNFPTTKKLRKLRKKLKILTQEDITIQQDGTHLGRIRDMRVPVESVKVAGSWGYLTGSWRESTALFFCYFDKCKRN